MVVRRRSLTDLQKKPMKFTIPQKNEHEALHERLREATETGAKSVRQRLAATVAVLT